MDFLYFYYTYSLGWSIFKVKKKKFLTLENSVRDEEKKTLQNFHDVKKND